MNIVKPLSIPEYLFRPKQVLHRLKWAIVGRPKGEFAEVRLPWGTPIRVRPGEVIGSNIWCYGVFDLEVTEAIARLLDPGETALDIGANIGQMSSLMLCKLGPAGKIFAFEPHPDLFAELEHNIGLNPNRPADLHLLNVALSDSAGEALLDTGPSWEDNRGMSRLLGSESQQSRGKTIAVRTITLDEVVQEGRIGLCKMDVEGHELSVLNGAGRLLREHRIRDLIFEDLGSYPSDVHNLLRDHGYEIFLLRSRVWQPYLVAPDRPPPFRPISTLENYCATVDPVRAQARYASFGWQCLRRCDRRTSPAST